jgi:RsiW-degrading membrane proteinase PrsW (M82 family)
VSTQWIRALTVDPLQAPRVAATMQFDSRLDDDQQFDGAVGGQQTVSVRQQLKGLSGRSKASIVYVVALALFIVIISDWILSLFYVITHLCCIVPLLRWWRKHSFECPLDVVIKSFASGYILMTWSVLAALLVVVTPCSQIIALLSPVLGAFASTVGLVGVEELFKVLIARNIKKGLDIDR